MLPTPAGQPNNSIEDFVTSSAYLDLFMNTIHKFKSYSLWCLVARCIRCVHFTHFCNLRISVYPMNMIRASCGEAEILHSKAKMSGPLVVCAAKCPWKLRISFTFRFLPIIICVRNRCCSSSFVVFKNILRLHYIFRLFRLTNLGISLPTLLIVFAMLLYPFL